MTVIFIAFLLMGSVIFIFQKKCSSDAKTEFEKYSGTEINLHYVGCTVLFEFDFSLNDLKGKLEVGYLADTFLSDERNRYLITSPRWPNKNKKYLLEHPYRSIEVSKSFKTIYIDGSIFELVYWPCFYGIVKDKSSGEVVAQFLMEDHKVKHTHLKEGQRFFCKAVITDDLLTMGVFIHSYMREVKKTMEQNDPA